MLLVLLLGSVALQIRAWQTLRRRVVSGELTRLGGLVRYGAWAVAPGLLFVAAFLGLVGLEELSGAAIIPEPLGRAALPAAALLLGVAGLGWLCFSIQCARMRRAPGKKA
jgi:hypothetical protein